VRLGLRYVKGLRAEAGHAIVAVRAERPFGSVADLVHRVALERDEREALAAIGALASLGGSRRQSLWTIARPSPGPLFGAEGAHPHASAPPGAASPLREMTELERLEADYRGTGVTIGRHPMAMHRAALARAGVVRACDLAGGWSGGRVRVAGSVIVRQRPGTAKGFVFLSVEDETGIANVIVMPGLFGRQRLVVVSEPFVCVDGILQIQDGVVSVKADRLHPLSVLLPGVPSHDFG
jgi:error-prone DNA polymerase